MNLDSETFKADKNRLGFGVKQNSLDSLIHFLCFISVLLIGADKWGINVGVNFRIDQLFLVLLTLLLIFKDVYRLIANKWITLFAIFTIISVFFAFNFIRGVIFYFSIVYNIVFVFYTFESYVRAYGLERFIAIFRKTCYLQFLLLVLQFVLKVAFGFEFSFLPSYGTYKGIPRFNLWFYEPSYLANYIAFWFALAAFMFILKNDKRYLFDLIISAVMIAISTSTTGFIGIALVLVSVYFMWILKGFTLKKILFPFIVVIAVIVFRFVFSSLFDTFIVRLFGGNIDAASGGRISQWLETINVILERPLFGVGPGNYGLYLLGDTALGDKTYVPSNVTLELLATTGVFATTAFYGITVSLIVKTKRLKRLNSLQGSVLLSACVFSLIIFTMVLQVNQGYLRLYHWMFFGIISGGIKFIKKHSL